MDGLTVQINAGWLAFLILSVQMLSLVGSYGGGDEVGVLVEN